MSGTQPIAVVVAAKALDGLSLRMAAIAHNMANVNSPGFTPVSVDFEQALRTAAKSGPEAVDRLQFGFRTGATFAAEEDRRPDLLMADAAAAAMRYAAIADLLGRRLSLQLTALGGSA